MKEQEDRVDLCKDLIFRAVFGDESTKYVLKCLLNAVLEQAELPLIADFKLQNPFQLPVTFDSKSSIMDVHAVDKSGRYFDVEMQVQPEDFFGDRLFYYGAGLYLSGLKKGRGYSKIPKVVCVAFVNVPLSRRRPDVWFDKWQMHSMLGTGLGTEKMTNVFVRLPRVSCNESAPPDKFRGQLAYWVRILSSYPELTEEEKLKLGNSAEGFKELERRIKDYFGTEEGKKVFIAQRKLDSWLDDVQTSLENRVEEAERGREEAERGREEAERRREEDRLLYLERQKRMIVRLLKDKFGADAKLPENWSEGRSSDELERLTNAIFESSSLREALDLFQ